MEARSLEKTIRTLRKRVKKLDDNAEAAQVHKLRTKAREMETVAEVLRDEDKKARRVAKAIKPMRKAAGAVRDLDVLTAGAMSLAGKTGEGDEEQAAMTRLVESLIAMRKKDAAELVKVVGENRKLARRRLKRFGEQIKEEVTEGATALDAMRRNEIVRAAIERLTAELRQWPALSARSIHSFRIKLKELLALLRLEPDSNAGFVRALNKAKKKIGDWHDWQTLRERAGEILDARENRDLLKEIDKPVEQKLDLALEAGNALKRRYLRPPAVGRTHASHSH